MMLLQIFDQRFAILGALETGKNHFGPRHKLSRIGQVSVEGLLVPCVSGILIGRGIGETGDAAGLAVNDTGEAWPNLVLSRLERVANRTVLLEHGLPGL